MAAVVERLAPARTVSQAVLPGTLQQVLLSDSSGYLMTTCGEAYRLRYEEHLEPVRKSATLILGGLIDEAASAFIRAQATGEQVDPVAMFSAAWDAKIATVETQMASGKDAETTRLMGIQILERFVEDWTARGWMPMLDLDGEPIVQRWLRVELPGNVIYRGIIDVVVLTPDSKVLVVDLKTTSIHFEEFSLVADQLTGYQVMIEAHADLLGIERIDGLVFYDMVKRAPVTEKSRKGATGPTIEVDEPAPPRTPAQVDGWIREQGFIADDIRRRRFSRRPGKPFSSACRMCDYQRKCWKNDSSDLYVMERTNRASEEPVQTLMSV